MTAEWAAPPPRPGRRSARLSTCLRNRSPRARPPAAATGMRRGWHRTPERGAAPPRRVPQAPPAPPIPPPRTGIAAAYPGAAAPPPHVVYNPTPPVKPAAKKLMSCLSVLGLLVLA